MLNKKGLKKCCGLLFLLSIMVGLSLSVCSESTNALKYSYDAFNIHKNQNYYISSILHELYRQRKFNITLDSNGVSELQNNNFPVPLGYFNATSWNTAQQTCSDPSTNGSRLWGSSYDSSANSLSIYSNMGTPYTTLVSAPLASNFSSLSLPAMYNCINSSTYNYDSLFAGKINTSTGDYSDFINLSQEFGFDFTDISSTNVLGLKKLDVPLDLSQDNLRSIPSGTPLSWTFEVFSLEDLIDINSNATATLRLAYLPIYAETYTGSLNDVLTVEQSVSCSINPDHEFIVLFEDSLEINIHAYGYQVSCSYIPSTDMSYIYAELSLSANGGNIFKFSTSGALYFGTSFLVTNNDDTWSGLTANPTPTGNQLDRAPGYSDLYCDNGDPYGCAGSDGCRDNDWFCKFTHLFVFNSINPFSGIFSLFGDQSSCVSIPILASMLHSNETTYCPWFSSTTRSILTPVIGMSSTMLLFGFFVHWLGARSGNLFEDSVETDNYTFANKFRRKK